jgi:hypothetical protein
MQLTGGEGCAHELPMRRARVIIERRPQLISVFDGHVSGLRSEAHDARGA